MIGVIGGLGPEATLDFFAKVLRATPVEREQDHLHLLIDNYPKTPNRNESIAGVGPSCAPALIDIASRLERAGADLLVMPCNTAHAYEDEVRKAVATPLLSIIDVASDAVCSVCPGAKCIGVLAAEGALRAQLYQHAIADRGRQALTLTEQELPAFMDAIYRIKSGRADSSVRAAMLGFANALVSRGAEALIAACTEVPLALETSRCPVPVIDSTDALAHACVRWARGEPASEDVLCSS
jgi:aspartate racemase